MDEQWIADVQAFFYGECLSTLSRARMFAGHFDDIGAADEARLMFQAADIAQIMLPALQDSYDGAGAHRLLWTLREVLQYSEAARQKARAQELLDRAAAS